MPPSGAEKIAPLQVQPAASGPAPVIRSPEGAPIAPSSMRPSAGEPVAALQVSPSAGLRMPTIGRSTISAPAPPPPSRAARASTAPPASATPPVAAALLTPVPSLRAASPGQLEPDPPAVRALASSALPLFHPPELQDEHTLITSEPPASEPGPAPEPAPDPELGRETEPMRASTELEPGALRAVTIEPEPTALEPGAVLALEPSPPREPEQPPSLAEPGSQTTLSSGAGSSDALPSQPRSHLLLGLGLAAVLAVGVAAVVLVMRGYGGDDSGIRSSPGVTLAATPAPAPSSGESAQQGHAADEPHAAAGADVRDASDEPRTVGEGPATTDEAKPDPAPPNDVAPVRPTAKPAVKLAPKAATPAKPIAPAKAAAPPCDAAELTNEAEVARRSGLHARALELYEQAIRCGGATEQLLKRAYLAACNSTNDAKARQYFARLPEDQRGSYSQICVRMGIAL